MRSRSQEYWGDVLLAVIRLVDAKSNDCNTRNDNRVNYEPYMRLIPRDCRSKAREYLVGWNGSPWDASVAFIRPLSDFPRASDQISTISGSLCCLVSVFEEADTPTCSLSLIRAAVRCPSTVKEIKLYSVRTWTFTTRLYSKLLVMVGGNSMVRETRPLLNLVPRWNVLEKN
jgi:hypothetical protein